LKGSKNEVPPLLNWRVFDIAINDLLEQIISRDIIMVRTLGLWSLEQ